MEVTIIHVRRRGLLARVLSGLATLFWWFVILMTFGFLASLTIPT